MEFVQVAVAEAACVMLAVVLLVTVTNVAFVVAMHVVVAVVCAIKYSS